MEGKSREKKKKKQTDRQTKTLQYTLLPPGDGVTTKHMMDVNNIA